MGLQVGEYWDAAQAFRSAPDAEVKHHARVRLLKLALGDGPIASRAAAVLRVEGLAVIRTPAAIHRAL